MSGTLNVGGDLAGEPGMANLSLDDLASDDRARLESSMRLFEIAEGARDSGAWQRAGEATLAAYQHRNPSMPLGFEKLLVAQASECGAHLWEDLHQAAESLPLLDFAHSEIKSRGWGPNGNQTPLGRQHQYLVATRFEVRQALETAQQPARRGLFRRRST